MMDFNESRKQFMPGYTGHIKEPYLEDTNRPGAPPGGKKQIPGKSFDNRLCWVCASHQV